MGPVGSGPVRKQELSRENHFYRFHCWHRLTDSVLSNTPVRLHSFPSCRSVDRSAWLHREGVPLWLQGVTLYWWYCIPHIPKEERPKLCGSQIMLRKFLTQLRKTKNKEKRIKGLSPLVIEHEKSTQQDSTRGFSVFERGIRKSIVKV